MADEYRIAVGIDASGAKEGADQATGALDQIEQKAGALIPKIDKLEVTLTKVVDAAGNTQTIKELSRTLEDVTASTEQLKSALEVLKGIHEEYGNTNAKLKAILDDGASATDKVVEAVTGSTDALRSLQDQTESVTPSLRDMVKGQQAVIKALDESTGSVETLKVTLADMLKTQEQMGDLGAKQFLDMAAGADKWTLAQSSANTTAEESTKTLEDLVYTGEVVTTTFQGMAEGAEDAGKVLREVVPPADDWLDYGRGLEEVSARNLEVAQSTQIVEGVMDSLGPTLASAGDDWGVLTDQIAVALQQAQDYKQEWASIRADLAFSMSEVTDATERAYAATGGFSHTLALMAEDAAKAGDAIGASRLFDLSDEFREMEQHISSVLKPGSEMLQQFADAAGMTTGEVATLYETFGQLIADITEARVQFDQGKLSIEDFAATVVDLQARVSDLAPDLAEVRSQLQFETNASEASKEVEDMLEKLGAEQKSLENFAQSQRDAADAGQALNNTMTTLGATAGHLNRVFFRLMGVAGLGAAFYSATHEAALFSDQLVRMTNMADLTADEIERLSDDMESLGETFGNRKIEEAGAALAIMSRGFRDAAEATQVLAAANQLADATFSDVRSSAAALSQAMSAFEMDASQAEDAAATLAVASGGSAEAMQQMAFMAGRLGAVVSQAGLSLEDFSIAVSGLRQSGMETRRAVMGLTQLINSLSNLSTEASLEFRKYGIEISKARIEAEGLGPVLQDIYNKTNGNKDAMTRLLGSVQAATVLYTLMRNEGENYAKALDDMNNKTARMDEMAKRVNATFTKLAADLKNRLLNRLEEFGVLVKGTLIPVLKVMNDHIESVAHLMGAGFKVAGAVTAISLLSKALFGIRAHFIELAAASKLARDVVGKSALETEAIVAASSKRTVAQLTLAKNEVLMMFSGLGTAIIKAIIAWEVGKILRAELIKMYPEFETATNYISAEIMKWQAAVMLNVRDFADLLYDIIKIALHSILALFGLFAKALAELFDRLPLGKQIATGLRDWAETQFKDWSAAIKSVNTDLKENHDDYRRVINQLERTQDVAVNTAANWKEVANELWRASVNAQALKVDLEGMPSFAIPRLPGNPDELSDVVVWQQKIGPKLNPKQIGEMEQARKSDPLIAARLKQELLNEQIANAQSAVAGFTNEAERQQTLTALRRQLEDVNVQIAQLSLKKSAAREFFESVVGAADPAQAALFAYEDRLRALSTAMENVDPTVMAQQTAAAGIAYAEAAKNAEVFRQEALTVLAAVDPLTAATEQLADAQFIAAKALINGVDPAAVAEYLSQAEAAYRRSAKVITDSLEGLAAKYDPVLKATMDYRDALAEVDQAVTASKLSEAEQLDLKLQLTAAIDAQYASTVKLAQIQKDGLIQLVALYDPLIENEVARTEALIKAEELSKRAGLSEADRLKLLATATEEINEQYDRQSREIQGNITLADAWKKAWESAIERIDGSFAEMWKSAFDGMDDFAEQLKDTLKQVAAEIAHAKITRPLIMKAGEILTGKKDQPFGELGTEVMTRLGIIEKTEVSPFATQQSAEDTIAAGIKKSGLVDLSYGGTLDQGIGGMLSDELDNIVGRMGDLFGAGANGISLEIREGMNSALDDLSTMVMGNAQRAIMGSGPGSAAGTAVVGAGGGSGSGLGSLAQIAPMLGKFSTTLAAFGAAFKGGMSVWASGGGYGSMGQIASGAQSGVAGWGSMAGQAAASAGVGLASGWATDQLLGQRGNSTRNMVMSGVGGVVGGVVGTAFGMPIVGAALGGAIGSLVDNMIGGGEELKKMGYEIRIEGGKVFGDFFTTVKKYGSWFSSSTKTKREDLDWFNPVLRAMQAAFKQTRDMLLAFSEELGGSAEAINNFTTDIKISTKGKKPAQVEAEVAQAAIDMAGRQIQAFLGAAGPGTDFVPKDVDSIWDRLSNAIGTATAPTTARVDETSNAIIPAQFREVLNTFLITGKELAELNPDLKKAGTAFGNALHYTEEFIEAFKQLATLTVALNMKPSIEGLELYKKSQATLTEQYYELVDVALKTANQFDGTIESITAVTEAFVAQRTAAVQLAASLHQTAEEVSKMFADTATTIQESLMEPKELYDFRKAQAEQMVDLMRNTTDPAQLAQLASTVNSIVNSLYSSLDETQQKNMAQGFLDFLSGVDQVVREQADKGLAQLDTSAASVNEQVLSAMSGAADVQAGAADAFSGSVAVFDTSVKTFAAAIQLLANSLSGTRYVAPTTSPYVPVASREVNA